MGTTPDSLDELSLQSPEPDGPEVTLQETSATTLGELFVGARVCLRRSPRTCGEIVQIMPKMGRVVVRLDPPHPNARGRLRSLRRERLVIYS
jgi:hypothetical protein